MPIRPCIYLAGPTVFRPDARQEGERLKAICAACSCEGLFPLDLPGPGDRDPESAAHFIHYSCLSMLSRCQAAVADLSPFRGPHVDDGTALEIGFAYARGIPVVGYTTERNPLIARIPNTNGREVDGTLVEDHGQPFNAMIAGSIVSLHASAEEAIAAAAHLVRKNG